MAPLLAAALLLPLSYRTWQQSAIYQNEETLWRATLAVNPASWLAHENLANHLMQTKRAEEAIGHQEEALRLEPKLRAALELSSDDLETRAQLAVAYAQMGDRVDAEEQTKVLREHGDLNPAVQAELGQALLALDRPEEAVAHLQETVQQEPENAEAEHLLGVAAADRRDLEEAARHFRRALEINPEFVSARLNLANALMESGHTDEALLEYQQVVSRAPNYALGHQNLASALNVLGRYDEAMEQMKIVWRLQDEARRAPASPTPTP